MQLWVDRTVGQVVVDPVLVKKFQQCVHSVVDIKAEASDVRAWMPPRLWFEVRRQLNTIGMVVTTDMYLPPFETGWMYDMFDPPKIEDFVAVVVGHRPPWNEVVPTPVRTDPNATVAWSANVSPNAKHDLNIKSFLGRSSGETFQLEFTGHDGFVIIQPYEEISPGQSEGSGGGTSTGQGVSVSDFL